MQRTVDEQMMNKYHKIDSSGFTDVNTCYGFHGRLDITIISGQLIYQFVHELDIPVESW